MPGSVQVREGSSKNVITSFQENGEIKDAAFDFTNQASAFDVGPLPCLFPGLGQSRFAISVKLFQALENAGFATTYVSHDIFSPRMYIKPLNIKELNADYGEAAVGTLLPAEFICRMELTEKLMVRIDAGEVSRVDIDRRLWGDPFAVGTKLTPGFSECTTKFEAADRYITDIEAAKLIGKDVEWLRTECYRTVEGVFRFLGNFFRPIGFDLKAGKLELGLTHDGKIILADTISPDELTLVGLDGLSYDKDPVRDYYKTTFPEWHASLLAAKKAFPEDKSQWPFYPAPPPQSVIDEVVARYRAVEEAISTLK